MSKLVRREKITILGIESSCDETAAAIVQDGRTVLSEVVLSQIDAHAAYGGVVPELASRMHLEAIAPVVDLALRKAALDADDLDAIAVTHGPGLVGALLVGVSFAKAFGYRHKKPLIAVHHLAGHLAANYVEHPDLEPPFLALVVSGAHSHLIDVLDYGRYAVIGRTRDDAAGEAFDKVARAMGLGYPGGQKLDALAQQGQVRFELPRTQFKDSFDFSFSGLKTAAINALHKAKQKDEVVHMADFAASVQAAIVQTLIEHSEAALHAYDYDTFVVAGGVAANSGLRQGLRDLAAKTGVSVLMPRLAWCTDNAVMIAAAAYGQYVNNDFAPLDLNASAVLAMDR